MSWMMVPFLLSYVTANMVPLLATALATGAEEPVERGVVEDEVALAEALFVAPGTVELPVGLALTVTVVMVVFEKYTVEVARAAASVTVTVVLPFEPVEAGATPVACATPAIVVPFEKSATVALAWEVLEAESSSSSTSSVMLLPRGISVEEALFAARLDGR